MTGERNGDSFYEELMKMVKDNRADNRDLKFPDDLSRLEDLLYEPQNEEFLGKFMKEFGNSYHNWSTFLDTLSMRYLILSKLAHEEKWKQTKDWKGRTVIYCDKELRKDLEELDIDLFFEA